MCNSLANVWQDPAPVGTSVVISAMGSTAAAALGLPWSCLVAPLASCMVCAAHAVCRAAAQGARLYRLRRVQMSALRACMRAKNMGDWEGGRLSGLVSICACSCSLQQPRSSHWRSAKYSAWQSWDNSWESLGVSALAECLLRCAACLAEAAADWESCVAVALTGMIR